MPHLVILYTANLETRTSHRGFGLKYYSNFNWYCTMASKDTYTLIPEHHFAEPKH